MTASSPLFRLGTRGSPLALAQARMTRDALCAAHGWVEAAVEIVVISTEGDRVQDRPLAELGGKALWTKTLDQALLDGRTDASVHSMKDVETIRPDAIVIAAILERADVRDRLIGATSIEALPHGAAIGTSSPRRAAQLRHLRPDLAIVGLRGNVATRLARVAAGDVDATMLAAAGLDRLGQPETGSAVPVTAMLPAVAQGAVGIECRADDVRAKALLAAIDHDATHRCVDAERSLLAALGGSCHSPIGVMAVIAGGSIHLSGEILSEDGRERCHGERTFAVGEAGAPGALAAELLAQASPQLAALFQCAS